jgi:serine/threonine protein kinase
MAGDLIAGRYRLLEPLGRGGSWSSVWLADDLELDRRVAVKTLAPAADPTRFRREARAVALLAHPNIRALHDYGEDGRTPFIVLEYLPGGSLEEAHDELLRLTTPEEAYESHVLLIRHGRRTCTARAPGCEECPLLRMCPYGSERVRK